MGTPTTGSVAHLVPKFHLGMTWWRSFTSVVWRRVEAQLRGRRHSQVELGNEIGKATPKGFAFLFDLLGAALLSP